MNYDAVPQELKELNQWVLWRFSKNEKNEITKLPYQISGRLAKTNDPATWNSIINVLLKAKNFDGIGFVFTENDDFVGIDLDKCVNNGVIEKWALEIIKTFENCYVEFSQSGKGIHIIFKGKIPDISDKRRGQIEIYDQGRYFCMTGNVYNGMDKITEFPNLSAWLQSIGFIKDNGKKPKPQSSQPSLTNDQIIMLAKNAKNGSKFMSLYNGDISEYGSGSEADLAFVSLLSFYTQDKGQIINIVQQTPLWDDKWERKDYQNRTIDKCLSTVTEIYKGKGIPPATKQPKPIDKEIPEAKKISDFRSSSQIELKEFANTDYGNAERLVYYHGENIRYVWGINQWYFWNGKYWQVDNCGHIQRLAKDTARKIHKELDLFSSLDEKKFKEKQKAVFSHQINSESSIKQKAMIESARSETEIAIEPNQLDTNKWILNCNNGIIDLKTGELLDHDKKYLITKLAPVDYDPKAKLDMWNSFLKMVTNGNENIESFLQYAVGYSLTGNTSEEKLFFVYGPSATGKSTFIETIRTIFGDYAKTADFETFLSRSFTGGIRNDIAELAGARLVSSIEVDEGKKLAEGLVKTITGGDTIRARFLYQEAFQFLPQFKLWLVANHQPKVNAYDSAMWRRILVVPFEHVIPEEDRDPEVKTTLKNPEISGSAILAWAVQGCLRWQEYGLQIPREIKEASETYRQEMDVISDFIEEKCVVKVDLITTKQALYFQYKEWCIKAGIIPETKTTFGKMLKENNDIKDDSGAGNVSIWRGLGLKSMTNTQLAESQNS